MKSYVSTHDLRNMHEEGKIKSATSFHLVEAADDSLLIIASNVLEDSVDKESDKEGSEENKSFGKFNIVSGFCISFFEETLPEFLAILDTKEGKEAMDEARKMVSKKPKLKVVK